MAAGLAVRTTAALAMAIVVLSGCSDEQSANDSLPSPTAETTSSEALPPLGPPDFPVPDEAREKTPEGALEFTRYYISLSAQITNGTVDPQVLRTLAPSCALCESIAQSYLSDLAAGHSYGPFSYEFEPAGPAVMRGEDAEVSFVYSQSELLVYDSRGRVITERSAPATGELASGARLVWNSTSQCWNVSVLTIG